MGIVSECDRACMASMCRYVSFFRDAEVVYLMVHLREKSFTGFLMLRRAAWILKEMQKGMSRPLPCRTLPYTHRYSSTTRTRC